ncbi:MAG: endolytic transglycosylase MltG [Burkholderiaceae bacterium]
MVLGLLAIAAVLASAVGWWASQPFVLPAGVHSVAVVLPIGSTARSVTQAMAGAGVKTPANLPPGTLYWFFRLSGKAGALKAGNYEIEEGSTPRSLLAKLVGGQQAQDSVTIVDGWNIRQLRAALAEAEHLKPDTQQLSNEALMAKLGKPGVHPEGRFYPDTYSYAKGSSDLIVLQAAAKAMDKQLAAAWDARQPNLPIKTPEQALILASIIEKETGKPSDRPEIGGVFNNRLRIGMLLQTDPAVIYGMGDSYKGNIGKKGLQTDTPYNTYTRAGLPPTPISMPGKAALLAAVQPAQTKALYFVARGDGTSQFSATLSEHNNAVNKYIRGQ